MESSLQVNRLIADPAPPFSCFAFLRFLIILLGSFRHSLRGHQGHHLEGTLLVIISSLESLCCSWCSYESLARFLCKLGNSRFVFRHAKGRDACSQNIQILKFSAAHQKLHLQCLSRAIDVLNCRTRPAVKNLEITTS
jgi:hypothetical protein